VTDLAFLKGQFDYVVTDVPCSSTGTLRRNPDLKRTFRSANLQIITSKQFEIVAQALKYLKQGGELVYMTCSLLKQENCEQVRQIKAHFGLLEASPVLQTDPLTSDMDGFFSVRLKRI
jgi:16S rRNA (cytosine967-C5)-methyltransferase